MVVPKQGCHMPPCWRSFSEVKSTAQPLALRIIVSNAVKPEEPEAGRLSQSLCLYPELIKTLQPVVASCNVQPVSQRALTDKQLLVAIAC